MNTRHNLSGIFLLFVSATIMFGCRGNSGPDTRCRAHDLAGHWIHSYEEDQGQSERMTFRPAEYKVFPFSRYREQYIFHADGKCEWYYLAPDDGHHFRDGAWHCDQKERDVIRIYADGFDQRYRIIELTEDLLLVQPLN